VDLKCMVKIVLELASTTFSHDFWENEEESQNSETWVFFAECIHLDDIWAVSGNDKVSLRYQHF
jgi:hypothetical protein